MSLKHKRLHGHRADPDAHSRTKKYRDQHGHLFGSLFGPHVPDPEPIDLSDWFAPIQDQQDLAVCVSEVATEIHKYYQRRTKALAFTDLSVRFINYITHIKEQTLGVDCGVSAHDLFELAIDKGMADETLMPYDHTKEWEFPKTGTDDYNVLFAAAACNRFKRLTSIKSSDTIAISRALCNFHPIAIGGDIYQNWMDLDTQNDHIQLPKAGAKPVGSHERVICGWKLDEKGNIWRKERGSWGKDYANGGYYWVPEAYYKDSGIYSEMYVIEF